jgi:hypothetical protein
MFKRDWHVIIALIGSLFLVGASSSSENFAQKHEAPNQQKSAQTGTETTPTAQTTKVADEITKPCTENENNRRSELCAQWKAADAAVNSANSSWQQVGIGYVGIVIGFMTLVAAAMAAFYAKRAAEETKRGADTAGVALSADHRAWLSISITIGGKFKKSVTDLGVEGLYLDVNAVVRNSGPSPAMTVRFDAGIGLLGEQNFPLEKVVEDFGEDWRQRLLDNQQGDAIFPGQERHFSQTVFLPMSSIEDDLKSKEFKSLSVVVYGFVSYRTLYIDGVRQTRFGDYLNKVDKGGHYMAIGPYSGENWQDDIIGLTNFGCITAD